MPIHSAPTEQICKPLINSQPTKYSDSFNIFQEILVFVGFQFSVFQIVMLAGL